MTSRGALIGCGFFAENHLHAWGELDVELVAVCDIDESKAAAAAQRHKIARYYTSAEEMLGTESLDFVDIATTVATHRSLVELAARHGVAVICQKPFATNLEDADAMIASCEHAGVPLMVHENFRWQTSLRAVRNSIDKGAIGAPFFGRISFRNDYDIYAVQPYLAAIQRFAILDVGIHLLDLARFYFGEVKSLACTTQSVNPQVRGEDVATMLLQHVGGATSIIDASFFTHAVPNPFPQTIVEIDGSEGAIRLTAGYRMTVSGSGKATEHNVEPPLLAWMERPWHGVQNSVLNTQRHWLETLHSGVAPATSGSDNRRTLALALAAYDAAASGQTLSISQA